MKNTVLFKVSLLILKISRIVSLVTIFIPLLTLIISLFYQPQQRSLTHGKVKILHMPSLTLGQGGLSIPVSLNIDDVIQLEKITKAISNKSILIASNFRTEVFVVNQNPLQKSLSIIFYFVNALSVYLVLSQMVGVFKNAMGNKFFEFKTINQLENISIVIITTPLLLIIIKTIYRISISGYPFKSFQGFENFSAYSETSLVAEPSYLIFSAIGGFLFLLTKALKQALLYKQENELTI